VKRSVLATILVIQLVLVAMVWWFRFDNDEQGPESLLSFEPDSIQKIEISASGDEAGMTLVRDENSWQLLSGIPADDDKVEQFLTKLAAIDSGWPVAEKDSTAKRFEVTNEEHQRRIVLSGADKILGTLYLGTSPGYRKVHARTASGGPVYSIKFSVYEAGVDSSSWLNRSLLQPVGAVQELELEGVFSLSRDGEKGWIADQNKALDQDAVETLIDRFRNLTVMNVYEESVSEAPLLTYIVTDDEGSQRLSIVRLEKTADEDATSFRYMVSSDRSEGQFELAAYIAERMATSIDDLVVSELGTEDSKAIIDG